MRQSSCPYSSPQQERRGRWKKSVCLCIIFGSPLLLWLWNISISASFWYCLTQIFFLPSTVFADAERAEISIKNPNAEKEPPKQFTFDRTYGPETVQKTIYDITAAPIVGT